MRRLAAALVLALLVSGHGQDQVCQGAARRTILFQGGDRHDSAGLEGYDAGMQGGQEEQAALDKEVGIPTASVC
jgi:hypothetical protein